MTGYEEENSNQNFVNIVGKNLLEILPTNQANIYEI